MLEITERMFAGDEPHIVTAMDRLRSLGVRLALDDFGTGYSALAYLRRFPVTSLKIDRSFVSGLTHSPDDRALVEAIIRLGETFGLELVAEGIEECSQRDALALLGCRQGQGFLYSRPLPAAEARAYIAEHAAQPFPAGQA
jgi:EAL domain-containing protein (putative c-di-GMP-specific phosphodiesterase class I)